MKKVFLFFILICMLCLSGCGCKHEWINATCSNPTYCKKCQQTAGTAVGHVWTEATYEKAKTCLLCGQTEGSVLEQKVSGIYYTTNWRGGPATLELNEDGTCKGPIGTEGTYTIQGDKIHFKFYNYTPIGTIVDDGIMYENRFFERM